MTDRDITAYFDRIYDETHRKVLSVITAKCGSISDIQDIFQETYFEIYSVLKRKGKDYIKNSEAFAVKLAKRKTAQFYSAAERKNILSFSGFDEDVSENTADDFSPEDITVTEDLVKRLSDFLETKPLEVQKIFYLRFYLDMKLSEIAQSMAVSESYVKHKLYGTVREMRKMYEGEKQT